MRKGSCKRSKKREMLTSGAISYSSSVVGIISLDSANSGMYPVIDLVGMADRADSSIHLFGPCEY